VGRESAVDWVGAAAAGAWSGEDGTGVVTLVTGVCAVTSDPVAWELAVRESGAGVGIAKFEVLVEGEVFNPRLAMAVFKPDTCEGPGLLIGWLTLVER
jgi:hypothetical protein